MVTLSQDDIVFFRDNGYIIKRAVLDPELMEQARESLWANALAELDRNDPSTWVGPFSEMSDDENNVRHNYTWKYRAQGRDEFMLRLLAKDPSVWTMAEQLLGKDKIKDPERARGIYCMMPEGDLPAHPYYCHIDQHPFHLGVVGYIDDVDIDGGGFNVWAGSHKEFYPACTWQYRAARDDPANNKEISALAKRIRNGSTRVDCHGKAGDVIFWHHRLAHSAGHNRTERIRQAVLFDYKRKDLDEKLETPPQDDMWTDWDGVKKF